MNPLDALTALWSLGGLPPQALAGIALTGSDPVFPSSFAVGTAAQTSIAAAALAACELGHERGAPRQRVAVDMAHAAAECTGWFTLDGQEPELWDPFAGLYRCADGYVRVHTNFPHHRDGALRLLRLPALWRCSLYPDLGESIEEALQPEAIDEILRLHGPLATNRRTTTCPVVLNALP